MRLNPRQPLAKSVTNLVAAGPRRTVQDGGKRAAAIPPDENTTGTRVKAEPRRPLRPICGSRQFPARQVCSASSWNRIASKVFVRNETEKTSNETRPSECLPTMQAVDAIHQIDRTWTIVA